MPPETATGPQSGARQAAWPVRLVAGIANAAPAPRQPRLGAELLATASAAGTQDLAATGGRLAGEETVAAGAHEIAGLERPLHRILGSV